MDDEKVEQLVLAIEAAFDGVSREDGVTLHEAHVIDDYGTDWARQKARRNDTERRWQDVPAEWIEEGYSVLCFLDAKGFRYYIPAYMTWSLRNYRTSDSLTSDSTIYSFSHESADEDPRFALLDLSQRRAICQFLAHFAQCDDGFAHTYHAELALLRFGWDAYCLKEVLDESCL